MVLELVADWLAHAGRLEPAAVILGHLEAANRTHIAARTRCTATEHLIVADPNATAWRAFGAARHRDQLVAYYQDQLRTP